MILDFCNDWTFQKENEKPVKVNLPHDAMLYEVREGSSRNGVNSGYFPGGKYIYEKTFDLDSSLIGKSIELHFEGVYHNSRRDLELAAANVLNVIFTSNVWEIEK